MRSLIIFSITQSFFALAAAGSAYDTTILGDRPALFLPLSAPQGSAVERDLANGGRHPGSYLPRTRTPKKTRMPNGDLATVFDGYTEYVEVASALSLSVRTGHALTLEAWIRPDTLQFPTQEKGYVHWAGKGEAGEQEYVFRMYSLTNPASRPNRISGYVFNPGGQEGSGSYFQDRVQVGAWIHVGLVIDARASVKTVSIFKNGVLRKTTPFSQFHVSPAPGNAPLRIATRDFASFFKGAIGKFALYDRALSEVELKAHFMKMR